MKIRRIVTAVDSAGNAIVQSDSEMLTPYAGWPGFSNTVLWATEPESKVGRNQAVEILPDRFVPSAGSTRLVVLSIPPQETMSSPTFQPELYVRELERNAPGFFAHFEPDSASMHTTDTVDYAILLQGEIWLELDAGREVKLKPFDVVIQNGTRHAWHNKGSTTATLLFAMVGASRVVAGTFTLRD